MSYSWTRGIQLPRSRQHVWCEGLVYSTVPLGKVNLGDQMLVGSWLALPQTPLQDWLELPEMYLLLAPGSHWRAALLGHALPLACCELAAGLAISLREEKVFLRSVH